MANTLTELRDELLAELNSALAAGDRDYSVLAERLALIQDALGASGAPSSSGGATQAEIQTAIQSATNLNDIEPALATIVTRATETRDELIGLRGQQLTLANQQTAFANALSANTELDLIVSSLSSLVARQRTVASQLYQDANGVVFLQILSLNESTNVLTPLTVTVQGTVHSPVSPITPLEKTDVDTIEQGWDATANGIGYAIGDALMQITLVSQGPPIALVGVLWVNDGIVIAQPPIGHRKRSGSLNATEATLQAVAKDATLQSLLTSSNARATEATLSSVNSGIADANATLGSAADVSIPASNTATATLKGLIRRLLNATDTRLSEGSPITGEALPSGSGGSGWYSYLRLAVLQVVGSLGDASDVAVPASNTAASSAKGLLRRLLNLGDTINAKLPAALGQLAQAASLSVVPAIGSEIRITDGANQARVLGSGVSPVGTDPAMVVSLSPNSSAFALTEPAPLQITPAATFRTALNDNVLEASGGAWTDLNTVAGGLGRSFEALTFSITGNTAITGGTIVFEATNEPSGTNTVSLSGFVSGQSTLFTELNVPSNQGWVVTLFNPFRYRYVRVRISVAFTGTSTGIRINSLTYYTKDQVDYSQFSQYLATVQQVNTVGLVSQASIAAPSFTTDLSTSTISATTTSGSFAASPGGSVQFELSITAITGSLQVRIEESLTGTLWTTLHNFRTVTAPTTLISPPFTQSARFYRYVQTVAGGTPSSTRSISRISGNFPANNRRPLTRLGGPTIAQAAFFVGDSRIYGLNASNQGATPLFIQMHNSPTAPSAGAIPVCGEIYALAATSGLVIVDSAKFGTEGSSYGSDTWVVLSTTRTTYTPATVFTGIQLSVEIS